MNLREYLRVIYSLESNLEIAEFAARMQNTNDYSAHLKYVKYYQIYVWGLYNGKFKRPNQSI